MLVFFYIVGEMSNSKSSTILTFFVFNFNQNESFLAAHNCARVPSEAQLSVLKNIQRVFAKFRLGFFDYELELQI